MGSALLLESCIVVDCRSAVETQQDSKRSVCKVEKERAAVQ